MSFLEFLRLVNPALAVLALICLGYRLGPALLVGKHEFWQDRVMRFTFAGYILASAIGAYASRELGNKVGPATPFFTLLHLTVIIVMVFWHTRTRDLQNRNRT